MTLNYADGTSVEADEIRVDRYYRHIASDTYYKLHSVQSTPVGILLDIETIDSYGDVRNIQPMTNINGLYVKVGTFEEIDKKVFMGRKGE